MSDDVDDTDYLAGGVVVQINRIALSPAKRVQRKWIENRDGTFTWRKRIDNQWTIEKKNEPTEESRPLYSMQGLPFRPSQHSVTLDDFVFLIDKIVYVHLPTGYHFTARQINFLIFRDRGTWPAKLSVGRVHIRPTTFMRKFNRVAQSAELDVVLNAIKGMETLNAVA